MRHFCALAVALLSATILRAQAPTQYTLRVNGNAVVTNRPPERVAGEWFVPLAPVARALGADLKLDPQTHTLRVLRADGATTAYDGATGRILQGSMVAGQVSSFRQVQLNVGAESLLFPLSGVVALLGVTAREDTEQGTIEITSASANGEGGDKGERTFRVASLDERYILATNGQVWQQSINLRGQGLMGGKRLTGNVDLTHAAGNPMGFRQGSLRIELSGYRVVALGDQGTYLGVEAMANTLRGIGYEWRWKGYTVEVYGGRGAGSVSSTLGSSGLANYDTTLAGGGLRRKMSKGEISLETNAFGDGGEVARRRVWDIAVSTCGMNSNCKAWWGIFRASACGRLPSR